MCRLCNLVYSVFLLLTLSSVGCKQKLVSNNSDVVAEPRQMNEKVKANIEIILSEADENNMLQDSTPIAYHRSIRQSYSNNNYEPFWCNAEKWSANANLLINFINNGAMSGLFRDDYHFEKLQQLKYILDTDSIKKTDAIMWANADIILSDAFAAVLKDLKQGRLVSDSLSYKNDTIKYRTFFDVNFRKIKNGENLYSVLNAVEPKHSGYKKLKNGLKKFSDSMDLKAYTFLNYPYKDSLYFMAAFKKRITEEGFTIGNNSDSIALQQMVKKYQARKGLVVDGKIGKSVVASLNLNDRQKFTIIAMLCYPNCCQ